MEDKKIDIVDITGGGAAAGGTGTEDKGDDIKFGVRDTQTGTVEKLRQESGELQDKYMRLYAEFDNYRKRVQKEKDEIYKYGTESLVSSLLVVKDNLDAALSHVAPGASDALAEGVELTLKELKKILASNGVVEVETKGKPFDPAYHHAMAEVERDDLDDKTVVEEFRKGYTFKDRLIRAALVSVSKKAELKTGQNNSDINNKEADNG
ncbi:nucleotide exchange factor GrpE [Candidatus Magnetominusculus dajiuhuensis]|uniref:nucleotide exchange factor GrpE n=1 Tax=Candidatus Magnetominusculus dajiuhuensis TaxID=3137712 RepID=UPI003B431902